MAITFLVDDVTPAVARLVEQGVSLGSFTGSAPLGASHERLLLVKGGAPALRRLDGPPEDRMNVLAQAVDLAFNEHRPLCLGPDAIWITLAQGFAIHVRENAERLRRRFVRHDGRKAVSVKVGDVPRGAEWRELVAEYAGQMGLDLGKGVTTLLTGPFSTTGPDEQMVFRIALMETFSEYFEYEMVCICGIPAITLDGTADDWRDLKRRIEVMGEFDLRFWTDQLLPICDQWIAAADGRPDVEFWRAIYRPAAIYGGHLITGWLARLFPYVEGEDHQWIRNDFAPGCAIPEDETHATTWAEYERRGALRRSAAAQGAGEVVPWAVAGVSPSRLPSSWSQAEIVGADDEAGNRNGRAFRVAGGLAGVAQDPAGLSLTPVVAWVAEEVDAPWRRLEADHAASPRRDARPDPHALPLRGGLREFYRRYDSAVLFDGLIEILPRPQERGLHDSGMDLAHPPEWFASARLLVFGRVGGGGALAWMGHRPDPRYYVVSSGVPPRPDWIVYIPDASSATPADVVVIALDARSFFERLTAQATPYFLEPGASLPGPFLELLASS